jgi:hypothetical protein
MFLLKIQIKTFCILAYTDIKAVYHWAQSVSDQLKYFVNFKMIRNISSLTIHHHPMTTTPTPDLISTSDFVREALKDAVLVSMLENFS